MCPYLSKSKFTVVRRVHDADTKDAPNWKLSKDGIHFLEKVGGNPRWNEIKQRANANGRQLCPLVALKQNN